MPFATKEKQLAWARSYRKKNSEKVKSYMSDYYQNHLEEARANRTKWRVANPEKRKMSEEKYYKTHKEKISERTRLWRKRNHDRIIAVQRRYREENLEKVLASNKKWEKENPEKKREVGRRYRALKLNATVGEVNIKKLLDDWNGDCGICGFTVFGEYHIDHKIPLSKEGKHEQSNLQIAHARCNRVKSNKLIKQGV